MALPASGQISMSEVNVELSNPATTQISLNDTDVRVLFGVPSGAISLSDGYGCSSYSGGTAAYQTRLWPIVSQVNPGWTTSGYVGTVNKYEFSTSDVTIQSNTFIPPGNSFTGTLEGHTQNFMLKNLSQDFSAAIVTPGVPSAGPTTRTQQYEYVPVVSDIFKYCFVSDTKSTTGFNHASSILAAQKSALGFPSACGASTTPTYVTTKHQSSNYVWNEYSVLGTAFAGPPIDGLRLYLDYPAPPPVIVPNPAAATALTCCCGHMTKYAFATETASLLCYNVMCNPIGIPTAYVDATTAHRYNFCSAVFAPNCDNKSYQLHSDPEIGPSGIVEATQVDYTLRFCFATDAFVHATGARRPLNLNTTNTSPCGGGAFSSGSYANSYAMMFYQNSLRFTTNPPNGPTSVVHNRFAYNLKFCYSTETYSYPGCRTTGTSIINGVGVIDEPSCATIYYNITASAPAPGEYLGAQFSGSTPIGGPQYITCSGCVSSWNYATETYSYRHQPIVSRKPCIANPQFERTAFDPVYIAQGPIAPMPCITCHPQVGPTCFTSLSLASWQYEWLTNINTQQK